MYVSQSSFLDYLAYYIDKLADYKWFKIILVFFQLLWQYLPYIFLSILFSALLAIYLTPKKLGKLLCFNKISGIIIASLLGAISPLSSYALIPFAGALLSLGFPLGAVSAFVISTPLMNPTIFILTLRGLGLEMALARLVATILIGIIAGLLAELLFKRSVLRENLALKMPKSKAFWPTVGAMARYMSKAFLLALLLASLVRVFLKPEAVAGLFGADKPWSISLAALLGVPFYTCGGATIPIVSSLIDLGMDRSAALAFFIAGPATNLPNVSAVFLTFKWYFVLFYLLVSLLFAVLSGYLFNIWLAI